MFDLVNILLLITFAFNLFLSLFVHFRSSRNKSTTFFEFAIFAIAFWVLAMSLYRSADLSNNEFLARILYFAASFTAPFFLLFSLYFPSEKPKSFILVGILCWTLFIAGLCLIPTVIIKNIQVIPGQEKVITFGWGYPFYVIHISSFFISFYVNMIFKFLKFRDQPSIKLQIQYVLLSTTLVSSLAMITNLFLPTFGNFTYNWVGQVLTTFWVAAISYAIVKHRLMDIRLVVARTIAYSLLVLLIGVFYVGSTFILSSLVLGITAGQNQLILYTMLTLIVALSFERLKRLLEKLTEKIFYKSHYDSNQLLAKLAHIMSTDIQLRSLASRILQTLIDDMKISRGAFILIENKSLYGIVEINFPIKGFEFIKDFSLFLNLKGKIVYDEIEESFLKEVFRKYGIEFFQILEVKEGIVGVVILGSKFSGETYNDQDIKLLEILIPEVAIAIQNAQSFDKIQKFNVTLTQEVEKATRDLKTANLKLQELDKLKDDFVSIASHELRTPMTAIRSYVWMALHKADIPLSQKLQRYLYRTLISTERLINLVNDMLNISRIESGRVQITPQVFDIQALVKEVFTEVDIKAKEKNLQLKIVEDPTLPKVFADPDKVHQVLLNLVGNALKFTPANGVITLSFFSDGKEVEVLVKDSGVGISKEDLAKLFTKFGRLESSYEHSSSTGGTGLGLYICKSLINMMKGRVWATSEGVGKGTTFIFTLPVASAKVLANAEKYHIKPQGEAKGLEPVSV